MKSIVQCCIAGLLFISVHATAQSGGFMDGFMKGSRDANEMMMRDEQLRILRLQRQEMELRRQALQEQRQEEQRLEDQRRSRQTINPTSTVNVTDVKVTDEAIERWSREVDSFKKFVKAVEGIDYDASPVLFEALDSEVKRLAYLPENAQKESIWFLSEAHKNIKQRLSKK